MKPCAPVGILWALALGLASALAGCDQPQMANQPKYEVYERAPAWADGQSARRPPAGTIARGTDLAPRPDTLPVALTRALLERGQAGYEVNCLPCHGGIGYADGMVVQRGFPQPPSFHSERLRRASLAYIYDVITHGYGVMYAYRDRVEAADRWAIAAYIRALQQSQHTPVAALSSRQRQALAESDGAQN